MKNPYMKIIIIMATVTKKLASSPYAPPFKLVILSK